MNYNELKIRILKLFNTEDTLDSLTVRKLLLDTESLTLTDKAVEMALMRYFRQGLLNRSRKSRVFRYSLTERGNARRDWLMQRG